MFDSRFSGEDGCGIVVEADKLNYLGEIALSGYGLNLGVCVNAWL